MVCIVVRLVVVVVSGRERADALGRVRVDARGVLLVIERDAIQREGECAVSEWTISPPLVRGTHVLTCLPPGDPAVDKLRHTALCGGGVLDEAHRRNAERRDHFCRHPGGDSFGY